MADAPVAPVGGARCIHHLTGIVAAACQIRTAKAWRAREEALDRQIARAEAVRLAARICELDNQLKENYTTLRTLVAEHAPDLLEEPGIGPYTAAVIQAAWSHPGRVLVVRTRVSMTSSCPCDSSTGFDSCSPVSGSVAVTSSPGSTWSIALTVPSAISTPVDPANEQHDPKCCFKPDTALEMRCRAAAAAAVLRFRETTAATA